MEATINFSNKLASVCALHRNHNQNQSQWSTSAYYQNRYNNRNRNRGGNAPYTLGPIYNEHFFSQKITPFLIHNNANKVQLQRVPHTMNKTVWIKLLASVTQSVFGYNYTGSRLQRVWLLGASLSLSSAILSQIITPLLDIIVDEVQLQRDIELFYYLNYLL